MVQLDHKGSCDYDCEFSKFSRLELVKTRLIMGKAQKKTGKGRLDKYYKLAKYVLYITNIAVR